MYLRDQTWKLTEEFFFADKMVAMDSAALTGTVDFSTMILLPVKTVSAISLAARSTNLRFGAFPFPEIKFNQNAKNVAFRLIFF